MSDRLTVAWSRQKLKEGGLSRFLPRSHSQLSSHPRKDTVAHGSVAVSPLLGSRNGCFVYSFIVAGAEAFMMGGDASAVIR